jgi:hypothetical protein
VHELDRHLAACDLAAVQGGLTTVRTAGTPGTGLVAAASIAA